MTDAPIRELPNNIEAEQALLGTILMNNRALSMVSQFLEDAHFYEPLHRKIYAVTSEIIRMGKPANPILLKTFLPGKIEGLKIDGKPATISQYMARLAAEAVGDIRELGIAIHEAWMMREAISAAMTFLDLAYNPSPGADIIGDRTAFEERLDELRGMRVKSDNRRSGAKRWLDKIKSAQASGGSLVGIPIVLPHIQRVLGEPTFEIGNLYGLLSSSGEGKTSLMVQIAAHALAKGCAVQIQSYDQSEEQIIAQMCAQAHRIDVRRQKLGELSIDEMLTVDRFSQMMDQQRWQVRPCGQENADALVSYAGAFVREKGWDRPTLVVTDHVGRIVPERGTERSDAGIKAAAVNAKLKEGAKSKGVAWLALNQRNTEGMKRANPKPIAADLYGGEGAKQSYDAVFYLYRYLKFYRERQQIAATHADKAMLNSSIWPSDVREGKDIAEIGAIKVRFGDVNIRESLNFNARYTLLEEPVPTVTQEELSFLQKM